MRRRGEKNIRRRPAGRQLTIVRNPEMTVVRNPNADAGNVPLLADLLAAMRASYEIYRNAHWQTRGNDYYGKHLLFERLYKETAEHVDKVAERIVGYYGSEAIEARDQAARMALWMEEFAAQVSPLQASMQASEIVRRLMAGAYDALKSSGEITLGWDDLLMELSSAKDEHVYLLQQALAPREYGRQENRTSSPRMRRLKQSLTRPR